MSIFPFVNHLSRLIEITQVHQCCNTNHCYEVLWWYHFITLQFAASDLAFKMFKNNSFTFLPNSNLFVFEAHWYSKDLNAFKTCIGNSSKEKHPVYKEEKTTDSQMETKLKWNSNEGKKKTKTTDRAKHREASGFCKYSYKSCKSYFLIAIY